MRLIDADALDDVVQDLNENKNYGITRGEYKLIDAVLFEFPTIEERKKGEWITHDYKINGLQHAYCECTVCGGERPITLFPLNYCPNCGARMEGNT